MYGSFAKDKAQRHHGFKAACKTVLARDNLGQTRWKLRSSEIFDEKVMTFNVYFIELDFDNWLSFLLTLKGIL